MRARSLYVLSVFIASNALAAPKKAQPPAADVKKARALLAKGRVQEDKKQYKDAIASFEAMLAIIPDDSVGLSELGFTAYLAKDYKKAETATRSSLANQATPSVRGATLFNLGLILEEKGDKAGAIVSYLESLRVRRNAIVLGRLDKLDHAAAQALDPYRPTPLTSYASVGAFCKTLPSSIEEGIACKCTATTAFDSSKKSAPFDDVVAFTNTCGEPESNHYGTITDYVAVKVGGSWFPTLASERDFNRHCETTVKYTSTAVTSGHLVATYDETGDCAGGGRESEWTTTRSVVLGVGASKVPSAMPTLVTAHHETETDENPDGGGDPKTTVTADTVLDLVWGGDGSLEVKGTKTKGLDATESKRLVGKHALEFP